MRERKRNNLRVLYEDETIVVVDKPSGMLVDEVAGKIGGVLVHRLDKDTSGVMVLARSEVSAANLKKQFEERKVKKQYLALVHGLMKENRGLITSPVKRYPKDQKRSAITEWQLAKRVGPYSLVNLYPHTGRTHQLRIHMKSIGHPIVSDPIYGFRKKIKEDLQFCPRMFLHAAKLQLIHPQTGKLVSFEAELPQVLKSLLH